MARRPGNRQDGLSRLMRVLIADDSRLVAERVSAMLAEIDGVEIVGQAESVPDTREAVRRLKPDVLILDLRMPGGSGLDVLESLRREGGESVVIVLTNYSFPQYREKCLKSGARFFFDKSSEFDRVAEVLRGLVGEG